MDNSDAKKATEILNMAVDSLITATGESLSHGHSLPKPSSFVPDVVIKAVEVLSPQDTWLQRAAKNAGETSDKWKNEFMGATTPLASSHPIFASSSS